MNAAKWRGRFPQGITGFLGGLLLLSGGALLLRAGAEEAVETGPWPAVVLDVEGPIGPATDDYLRRALDKALERQAPVAIIRINTPGGLDTSMRAIISRILDSPIPVAVYVAPEGARAASAGTYILYAAHIAAMAPATSVGAATPVQMGSPPEQPSDEDETKEESPGAMERKVINDAVAYIRGLAELRGRNGDWAEEAVRRGISLTSSKALEAGVIDLLAPDLKSLLEAMDGRTVIVLREEQALATRHLEIERIEPDWRTELLSILTDPNVAFILILLGIYGLIFEFANPGAFVPGIAGAICLLLGLFALQLIPINYAGLALIVLGIILMIAEAFAPSFGALGIGGVIAFILGSIILIDTEAPGFQLSIAVILGFAVASALVFILFITMALKARRLPVVSGREGIVGAMGAAMEDFETEGQISVQGESWKARTARPIRKGQSVRVTAIEGLTLDVEPQTKPETEQKSS